MPGTVKGNEGLEQREGEQDDFCGSAHQSVRTGLIPAARQTEGLEDSQVLKVLGVLKDTSNSKKQGACP